MGQSCGSAALSAHSNLAGESFFVAKRTHLALVQSSIVRLCSEETKHCYIIIFIISLALLEKCQQLALQEKKESWQQRPLGRKVWEGTCRQLAAVMKQAHLHLQLITSLRAGWEALQWLSRDQVQGWDANPCGLLP